MSQFYGVHVYNLKPGVPKSEFERFMEQEWFPFMMRQKGCHGVMFLKGYQGEWMSQKMDYATIDIWDSPKANRQAWGGARREWTDPPELRPLMTRFRDYVLPESFRTFEFERMT
jgi:hypothetical protein